MKVAIEYDLILQKLHLAPPLRTRPGHGEHLPDQFAPNSFDFAYARNALDHTYDPWRAINQMVAVVRRRRFVVLRHRSNEAESASYQGLHRWNFEMRHGDFVIWNQTVEHNVTRQLRQSAQVECGHDGEWMICAIEKLGDPPAPGGPLGAVVRSIRNALRRSR